MKQSFIDNLLAFYNEDPKDPFNVYALAIEYTKSDARKACHFFDILLTEHPDYLAAYYHAAALFASLDNFEKADQIYNAGMILAMKQSNIKTHQELVRAYRGFLDEWED